jgi:hypothetical protein
VTARVFRKASSAKADPVHGLGDVDWLRLVRLLTLYIVPELIVIAFAAEVVDAAVGSSFTSSKPYNAVLLSVFSILSIAMMALCGWVVFLWDIDRLFFKLEGKIDAELGEAVTHRTMQLSGLVGRTREALNAAVRSLRSKSIAVIEKAYWDDINAVGILAFPQPDISAAVERIDQSRHDLLAPLTKVVASAIPVGTMPAALASRIIFRYVAPQVKVRLFRRLVLRFLVQFGALFALTALCFFVSMQAWSRINPAIFAQVSVQPTSVVLYQLDLMLRGALFDFMEHTRRSVSPISVNQNATAFVYYTLLFRMFVAIYAISSVFRVAQFVARRWRPLLKRW